MRLLRPLRITAETPTSELLREALQRAALSGALFGLLMLLGHGIGYAVVAATVFSVFMGGFFLAEVLWRRQLARRHEASGDPDPAPARVERPAYYPSFWPDDAMTRWTMRTPRRALIAFVVPGALFGGLLFWRVADSGSFSGALGESTGSIVLVAGPLVLGFCWYFGVRAWTVLRTSGA